MTVGLIILAAIVIFVLSGIKVVNQYQRGVVLTLGKFTGVKSPGLRLFFPGIQSVIMVDVRSTPIDVPKQEVITKDNVTVGVDAVVYFQVIRSEPWLSRLRLSGGVVPILLMLTARGRPQRRWQRRLESWRGQEGAINLRTLNTLERISTEPSQKTMTLFPIELIDAIRGEKK